MSIVFIGFHSTLNAGAVYTDIDPDIILDESYQSSGVDIDNNGVFDFAFLNLSYHTFTSSLNYEIRQRLWVGPYETTASSVSGEKNLGRYYPYALVEGDYIQNNYYFHNW